jgi:hypothetical protein
VELEQLLKTLPEVLETLVKLLAAQSILHPMVEAAAVPLKPLLPVHNQLQAVRVVVDLVSVEQPAQEPQEHLAKAIAAVTAIQRVLVVVAVVVPELRVLPHP